jgi:hypothetical protein
MEAGNDASICALPAKLLLRRAPSARLLSRSLAKHGIESDRIATKREKA